MRVGHLLAHLVRYYHEADERHQDAIRQLREELKKSWSVKNMTVVLKKRFAEHHKREELYAHLIRLEQDLLSVKSGHEERAAKLHSRIQEIKKKIETVS